MNALSKIGRSEIFNLKPPSESLISMCKSRTTIPSNLRVCPRKPLCALAGTQAGEDSPPAVLPVLGPIFSAPKSEQEKGIGAFRANAYSQQPAVRAAARVCGFWKLTLFSRFPERFDAKFEKSRRKAPCHNGLRRRFDRKSVRFIPL